TDCMRFEARSSTGLRAPACPSDFVAGLIRLSLEARPAWAGAFMNVSLDGARAAFTMPVPERRRAHAKTTARGISVRRIVRFCPVSTAPDPAHRALGRGRRHRCDGAHHRKPAGEGVQ